MFSIEEFIEKFLQDFKILYPEVKVDGEYLIIGNEVANIEVLVSSLYKEYLITNYDDAKKIYMKMANKILNEHIFHVDYSKVYPILKNNNFGTDSEVQPYRKKAFLDLDVLYVIDMDEFFRFVNVDDSVDFQLLEQKAMENINRMVAALVPFEKGVELYTLPYTTDYASSLLLSETMDKQIRKKLGNDILLVIPSNTFFLVAKYSYYNQSLLEYLIDSNTGPDRVSNIIYRCKDGVFSAISSLR